MANAKRCDICGEYYQVPDVPSEDWLEHHRTTSMVRLLRLKDGRSMLKGEDRTYLEKLVFYTEEE